MRLSSDSQRGSTILQVIFLVFASMGIALAISKTIGDSTSMAKFVSNKMERETIAQVILMNTSCPKTFPSVPGCSDGSYVNLTAKTGTNNILVKADGTSVIGGYNIRARCVNQPASNNFGLDIRIAKPISTATAGDPRLDFEHNASASFTLEPVSKLPLGWHHPKASLFALPSLAPCASAIGGNVASLSCKPGEFMTGTLPNGLPQCASPAPKASCYVASPVSAKHAGCTDSASCNGRCGGTFGSSCCPAGQYGGVLDSVTSSGPSRTAWDDRTTVTKILCCR